MDDGSTRDWLLLIADALEQWPALRDSAEPLISSPAAALTALVATLPSDDRIALIDILRDGRPGKTFEEEALRLREIAKRLPPRSVQGC